MDLTKNRNLSIELLKILSILMIFFCHAVPVTMDLYSVAFAERLLFTFMRYGGKLEMLFSL